MHILHYMVLLNSLFLLNSQFWTPGTPMSISTKGALGKVAQYVCSPVPIGVLGGGGLTPP